MAKKPEKTGSKKYYAGIDIGSVSVNCIVINSHREIVYESPYHRHSGQVETATGALIREVYKRWDTGQIKAVAFTGNHGRKISRRLGCFYEFDTISQILGSLRVCPDVKTIISMGGQDTALFQISHEEEDIQGQQAWKLDYFNSNGPCASGTGSFIDQQAQRLSTSIYAREQDMSQERTDKVLYDFISLGLRSDRPSNVACRCTVFTKSDMIHLQNKGEQLEDIIYGLHLGNARNYISTIVSNRVLEGPILFIGGLSLNELQVKAFKSYFPGLTVPKYSTSIGALGVALQALTLGIENSNISKSISGMEFQTDNKIPEAPRLELKLTKFPDDNLVTRKIKGKDIPVYLGIDVGSTTTKYAIITIDREIIHKSYIHTQGKPIEATQTLLSTIRDAIGRKIAIRGAAVTGSGRNVVGDFLNADLVIDEITAHARGAIEIDPTIDTIFEIGGQDSKYINIVNTYPLDFDMNKVCAAGTGSFLHELANKYGINIVREFQEIALGSDKPVRLAERCTVFMESDLVSYHQQGARRRDLIAGLCYAITHNYLNRVVGKRKIGKKVMFLGGPSLNKGVVAAFENVLGRGLVVPKHREVLGAYGAAVSLQEKMILEDGKESSFRGLNNSIADNMEFKEKICTADPECHNQCKLKIYDFDGRKSIWGGECGRYELIGSKGHKKEDFFDLRDRLWQTYMSGLFESLSDEPLMEVDGRQTIGMQNSLYTFHTGILWAHFFDYLGYRLVLTPNTNSHISRFGIEAMTAETCYPVKVSHGHVRELAGKTRYIFLPTIIDMPTPNESESGFYCPFSQANRYMVCSALELDRENVLSPVIHLKYDFSTFALELGAQICKRLGKSRKQVKKALGYALERHEAFEREMYLKGENIIQAHDLNEPLVIVTGRPYNLYDTRLNLRLGRNLSKIGVKALPMDFIDVRSVDLNDFPHMYWGLGAKILRSAKFIKSRNNYFGLHVTNFSCGPDSFLEHFYRFVMGDRPYLILELDEHIAMAGVMTRLEAYKNVIENSMKKNNSVFYKDMKVAN